MLRCDRCDVGDSRRGGGVLIALRRHLVTSHVSVNNSQNVEQVWAKIQLTGKNIFIGAAYIPPNADPQAYEQLVTSTKEIMNQANPADNVFLTGDLNCPVTWVPDSENPCLLRSIDGTTSQVVFLDSLTSLGLSQICNIHSRNQLELIFTDLDSDFVVERAAYLLKRDSYHHVGIECTVRINQQMP